MKAEPKRRVHTIGAKWLRTGGVSPAVSTGEGHEHNGSNSVSVNAATGQQQGEKLGEIRDNEMRIHRLNSRVNTGVMTGTETNFQINISTGLEAGKSVDTENNELIITDVKRRRMDQEVGLTESLTHHEEDVDMGHEDDLKLGSKNLGWAGAALQARHSS